MSHTIKVAADGTVRMIYDDDLADVAKMLSSKWSGTMTIRRVSHVEPDADGRWWADLSPLNGPRLGPFTLRREALEAERKWIECRL